MKQDRFPRALALLRVTEGGYSNHPADPGGATMKGVTQKTYDAYRRRAGLPMQDVRKITDGEVETIYRQQYWNAVRADDLPPGVAYCVFDAAVNSGAGRAVQWLQAELGVRVDGIVGNETIAAVRAADPVALINRYCDRRFAYMRRLAHWRDFENGWTRRINEVRAQSIEWARSGAAVTVSTQGPQPKADGPVAISATVRDAVTDRGALTAAGSFIGSLGALTSGQGPVQYAVAAVLVLAALTAIWWLVRGRSA